MKHSSLLCCLLAAVILAFTGCDDHDEYKVPRSLRAKDFVWKGMNLYYLWQQQVPDLADDRFENQRALNSFLTAQPDPIQLFNQLRTDPSVDRFSVMYSDYSVLEGVLTGITKNNGVDFGLRYKPGSTTDIFGWVRYILPNSDAASKNIQRGHFFYAVNGQSLTVDNYRDLLSAETYTLNMADFDNGNITPNGESVTVTKTVYSENPVLINKIFNQGNHRIGYLMYNGFYTNYEAQLNNAFGQFQSAAITDLVLDLRYNSGGSIATATALASMITGQFTGQVFGREQWNEKVQQHLEENSPSTLVNSFTSSINSGAPVNSLNLSKVYILTSRSTASASELIINCLRPYIEVVVIGDVTTGKNVGSITLYDSPDFKKQNVNPDHKYAMQPIVLKIVNRDGFGDYPAGLNPDYPLIEDFNDLGELGEESEPLLSTALGQITANGRLMRGTPDQHFKHFKDAHSIDNLRDQMYREEVPPFMAPLLDK